MQKLITVVIVGAVAAVTAGCNSHPGTNSAYGMSPLPSITAPSALELRGGNGGGNGNGKGNVNPSPTPSSLELVMVDDDNEVGPNWGDSVSFDVFTDATTDPRVSLSCSQNGVVVLGAQTPTPWPWRLATSSWQGGAADCIARLYYINVTKVVELKSISFTAAE
jgi:hypothetical protein